MVNGHNSITKTTIKVLELFFYFKTLPKGHFPLILLSASSLAPLWQSCCVPNRLCAAPHSLKQPVLPPDLAACVGHRAVKDPIMGILLFNQIFSSYSHISSFIIIFISLLFFYHYKMFNDKTIV